MVSLTINDKEIKDIQIIHGLMKNVDVLELDLKLNPYIRLNMFHDKIVYKMFTYNTTLLDIKLQLTHEDLGLNIKNIEQVIKNHLMFTYCKQLVNDHQKIDKLVQNKNGALLEVILMRNMNRGKEYISEGL